MAVCGRLLRHLHQHLFIHLTENLVAVFSLIVILCERVCVPKSFVCSLAPIFHDIMWAAVAAAALRTDVNHYHHQVTLTCSHPFYSLSLNQRNSSKEQIKLALLVVSLHSYRIQKCTKLFKWTGKPYAVHTCWAANMHESSWNMQHCTLTAMFYAHKLAQ